VYAVTVLYNRVGSRDLFFFVGGHDEREAREYNRGIEALTQRALRRLRREADNVLGLRRSMKVKIYNVFHSSINWALQDAPFRLGAVIT